MMTASTSTIPELNPALLPQNVATILMAGGTQRVDLDWHGRPKQIANEKLDALDDHLLLEVDSLADEPMAAAVRSLLYLWSGWPAEALTFAQAAPEKERLYIRGLRERQHGNFEAAKECFRQLGVHPAMEALVGGTITTIGSSKDVLLNRFRQLLEFGGEWEPYFFVDIFEQTLSAKVEGDSRRIVCRIQCLEFELLFRHCYEKATGRPIPERLKEETAASQEDTRRRLRRLREKRTRDRAPASSSSSDRSAPTKETPTQEKPQEKSSALRIACPKCNHVNAYAETARGKNGRCGKCGAVFLIPAKGAEKPNAAAETSTVSIACPKCRQIARRPEADRGKKCRCAKCGTVFVVPKK